MNSDVIEMQFNQIFLVIKEICDKHKITITDLLGKASGFEHIQDEMEEDPRLATAVEELDNNYLQTKDDISPAQQEMVINMAIDTFGKKDAQALIAEIDNLK